MQKSRFLLITIFLIGCFPLLGQLHWAPVGAKWHYDAFEGCEGGCQTGYLTIEVVGDSIVGDTVLSKLEIIRYYKFGGEKHEGFEFTFAKDSIVYYWRNDTSYVMYDFTKTVGESHLIYGKSKYFNTCESGNEGIVRIDSVGGEEINGFDTKYYYTTRIDTSVWEYMGKINSIYGNMYFLFATEIFCGVFDVGHFAGPLRCYEDSRVGLVSFSEYPCDQRVIPSVSEKGQLGDQVKLYPNPAENLLYLEVPNELINDLELKIDLFDLKGILLSTQEIESDCWSIGIEHLAEGAYIVKIHSPMVGIILIEKLIIK